MAGAIFLVAFHEAGVHWVQVRAIWVVSNDAGVPIEKSVGWFNFVFGALYTLVITTAWGLIFYAAFGPGSGAKPTYLIEDERSAKGSN
ncbi:MAG: hypothetical protein H7062_00905 [Candidatus Saccharimonas sp.]|nr:hypothetical protein [Planctomycetaceae bacterium]